MRILLSAAGVLVIVLLLALLFDEIYMSNTAERIGVNQIACKVTSVTYYRENDMYLADRAIVACPDFNPFYLNVDYLSRDEKTALREGDTRNCLVLKSVGTSALSGTRHELPRLLNKRPCLRLER